MRFRLIALGLCPLIAEQAHAEVLTPTPPLLSETKASQPPRLDFRLIAEGGGFDRVTQAPVRRSGLIASTEIAPNAALGFGFVRSNSRRSGDLRPGLPSAGSRKAAVSFQLKF